MPAPSTSSPAPTTGTDCAPGPDKKVRELPDVVVPAVTVQPLTGPDQSGQQVTLVDGLTIPAQVVDAGCVIQYDAPGGCLGAVRITAATIPPVTIPASVLKSVGPTPQEEFGAVTVQGVTAPAVYSPQVCQVETKGRLPAVTRRGIVRAGVSRNGTARPGGQRRSACDASGCVPEVRVETVRIQAVRLPDVDVDPARLESRKLPGQDVDVFTGEGKTSYVAPGDVLFDTDQATIRPDAARALRAIAVQIEKRSLGARLRVEGHTDDRGDETYGLRLSERRARAVADWLVSNAGFKADMISTKGFGEAAPAVPNTSAANRQRNRRVVISVLDR
jgi:outer membrane protein OmpA-like peptidoglycan-associated protein